MRVEHCATEVESVVGPWTVDIAEISHSVSVITYISFLLDT